MAAGLGLKTFVTGDVLTAADTNGYLMQGVWVFANAAARTAAVTSPQEGNMSYLKDTDRTEYYSGSAWVAITGSSKLVQVVNTQTGTVATGTTVLPNDNTIPQNTEGFQVMSLAITPTSATSILTIQVIAWYLCGVNLGDIATALFQDSTANALAAINQRVPASTDGMSSLTYTMVAGTTSATTFKVRIGNASAGTTTFNPSVMGGIPASSITIWETTP